MKVKLFVATLALWSAAAFAVPTLNDVKSAVSAGNYAQAEQMMQEVVAAKPGSAKAHYVYAEILAHDAKFDQAAREAAQAQQIDPALSFADDPNKFRDFQSKLQREQAGEHRAAQAGYGGYAPAHAQSSGVPGWVWGVGFAVLAFILWRAVTRRNAVMSGGPVYGGGGAAYGPGVGPYGGAGGPYGPAGPMGGTGGSLLGTGLAAAGGVAGGMLLEKYLEGQHGNPGGYVGPAPGSFDDGGAQAAGELENRPVDFGSGNDWGGGGGGADFTPGGGADFSPGGGGGDDSGGGW
jgi:hypothetical protein